MAGKPKLRPEIESLMTFSSLALPPDKPAKGRPKAVNRFRREELATRVDQVVDEVRAHFARMVWAVLMIFCTETCR
jgi:hypothetical protein